MEGLVNTEFWKGRKVFITGHNGFKGSWLSLWLCLIGAKVTGFSLPPATMERRFGTIAFDQSSTSWSGDICDLKSVKQALAMAEAEIVFHLAAQSRVRAGYRDPVGTFRTNVNGTIHLLEAVRHTPSVQVVVIATSDKVYAHKNQPNGEFYAFREQDRLGGHDPYSTSKAAAELVVESYRNSMLGDGRVSIATARAGNVLGGGDWGKDRIVPDLVRALMGSRQITLRNPIASRSWLHVLDALNGYLILAENLVRARSKFAGSWNFAPPEHEPVSVSTLVEKFINCWGTAVETIVCQDLKAPEVPFLAVDATKSRHSMGWKTLLNFDEILNWTVDWYRACADDPGNTHNVTQNQIIKFSGLKY